jgi:hypothetical protein
MKIRVGLAGIIGMLCLMIGVIAGGRAAVDSAGNGELAAGELTVAGADEHGDHGDDGHSHGEGDDHGDHAEGTEHAHGAGDDHGEHAAGGHAHDDAAPHGHGEGAPHAHDPTDPTHPPHDPNDPTHPPHDPNDPTHPPHPPGPDEITYTPEQLALLDATQKWIYPRFADVNDAIAAGYTSINDAGTGHEHFVNNTYLNSPTVLDPQTIESLVYEVGPGGQRKLVSGMYILPIGQTLGDVPQAFTTPQTPWHIHTNLCWKLNPIRVAGVTGSGQAGCPPDTIYFVTPPMLHVWLENTPCGWFADLESFTGDCDAHPH